MSLLQQMAQLLGIDTVWNLAPLASSYTDTGAATTTYGVAVTFQTDSTVDVFRDVLSDLLNEVNPYVDPIAQAANTWVRCTHNSGDDMTGGAARGVWHRCNVQRVFQMQHTSSGGADTISGNFDFELSSDASGLPIEAAKLGVVITAGELF